MNYQKKPKNRWKPPISASHLMLYISLSIYIIIALGALSIAVYCVIGGYYDYCIQMFIGLFSYCGATGAAVVGFYSTKAAKENEAAANERKYQKRLDMAREIYQNIEDDKLNGDSVTLLQGLITDGTTSVFTTGIGGAFVENTKFGNGCGQNLDESVNRILNDLNNDDEGMG